jgi:hypothetical protein
LGRCRAGAQGGSGGRKKGLQTILAAEVAAEIGELIGPEASAALDFEGLETALRRQVLELAARAVERWLNADTRDGEEPTLPCSCGEPARYAGRRAKWLQCVLGTLRFERAYYHCARCRTGFCPRDRELGLDSGALSPAVRRMVGTVGALVSFQEGSELLEELAGVALDPKQVERTAERLGREIAHDERCVVTPEPPPAPTMYLGLDGTGVPMRASEIENRQGKQPDGSAKTREVKLVTVWTAEGRDEKGLPRRDPGSVSYSAAIESAASRDTDRELSPFAQRVEREARRRGFDRAPRCVVLGDGAPWIWNLVEESFPGTVQVVDLYHAKAHLWDVAKAIYGAGTDLAEQWAKQRRDELDEGKIDTILEALRLHAASNDEARKCLDYVARNRDRMRYPELRAQGLCVASGVVEAGCKVTIGTRLKRAGMHWTVAGADAIIALRCSRLSGRFEDFWQRRAKTPAPSAEAVR